MWYCVPRCGIVCCAGNVVWCKILLSCGGEMCNVQHIASRTSPHHSTVSNTDHLWHWFSPNHTTFHVAPSFITISHFISHQHLSHTIPFCNTIFQTAPLILATLCTTHFRSHHILSTLGIAPPLISRITTFYTTCHCFAPQSASCIIASFHHGIWLWSHPIPHPTTMFHITFHITHQYSTTFCIPPLITSRITPLPLPRIAPCHSTHSTSFHIAQRSTFHATFHSTSFHIAQRSTFHATAHTPIHITPPLSAITPFQFERLGIYYGSFSVLKTRPKRVPLSRWNKNWTKTWNFWNNRYKFLM